MMRVAGGEKAKLLLMKTNLVLGRASIFKGNKFLKMKESENRIFRFRSRNTPGNGVSGL